MLLEALPLPRSVAQFLFGQTDEEEEEEDGDDFGAEHGAACDLTTSFSGQKPSLGPVQSSKGRRRESAILSWIASSENEKRQVPWDS